MASISTESLFFTSLYNQLTSNYHHGLGSIHRTINSRKFGNTNIVTTQHRCSSRIGNIQQFLKMDGNKYDSKWREK